MTAECYAPNAAVGNFARVSFNLGGTLARWMDDCVHETYQQIVGAVYQHRRRYGMPNGVAQAVHHTILPLARGRDKRCQVHWGIASYVHRFGAQPDGIWLPEMAVDYETLETVAEAGLSFVILSSEQVHGDLSRGAGPYRVQLPRGSSIAVFVRDRDLSNYFSFDMPEPEFARPLINEHLSRSAPGALTLIATDGETFGHHHKHGVQVLEALTTPSLSDVYEVTTLGRYLREYPPQADIEIVENTAWSCAHDLGRWATGCNCTPGRGHWKGALRRALDNLSRDIDEIYAEMMRRRNLAPWSLRDDYIRVLLRQISGPRFLAEYYLGHLTSAAQQRLLNLLEAQVYRQRMFVSCAFFFEDLERIEPRYAIANAARAIMLISNVTGDNLARAFRRDLRIAISPGTGRTGAQILDEILAGIYRGAEGAPSDAEVSKDVLGDARDRLTTHMPPHVLAAQ
ncbi:MAG: DUF3536 domain-containing protein [Anaerolineae bacterium]